MIINCKVQKIDSSSFPENPHFDFLKVCSLETNNPKILIPNRHFLRFVTLRRKCLTLTIFLPLPESTRPIKSRRTEFSTTTVTSASRSSRFGLRSSSLCSSSTSSYPLLRHLLAVISTIHQFPPRNTAALTGRSKSGNPLIPGLPAV